MLGRLRYPEFARRLMQRDGRPMQRDGRLMQRDVNAGGVKKSVAAAPALADETIRSRNRPPLADAALVEHLD